MSEFLAPYYQSVPLGYSILQTQNLIASFLTTNGWQAIAQVDSDYTDFIPPSSESIGTTKFREVVRVYYTNTTITIGSYQACIADAYPQSIRIAAKTGGAVAAAVTIDGATVTGATGSAGSTANDNLRELYYALKSSADATIMGWDHWYNGTDTIICTNKTITSAKTCSGNANVNYYAHGAPVLSGARSGFVNQDSTKGYAVTMDLTNGFIVYVQVNARTFTLATKCLTGVYGPVFASYIDHAEAIASMPNSPFCTPIELIIGEYSGSTNFAYGRVTHWWTIPSVYGNRTVPSSEQTSSMTSGETTPEFHPWTGHGTPGIIMDAQNGFTYSTGVSVAPSWSAPFQLTKLGLMSTGSTLENTYKITPMSIQKQAWSLYGGLGGYPLSVRFVPSMKLPDIYKWTGSEPNEASAMANPTYLPGSSAPSITLQQALDDVTAYTSILFNSVSGLSTSGGVVIGTEEFTYTGTSGGNTITGVLRSQNGTAAAKHHIGDAVEPITWFLKINNGAMMSGSDKPV